MDTHHKDCLTKTSVVSTFTKGKFIKEIMVFSIQFLILTFIRMVRLSIKKGDEGQFLYDTTVEAKVDDVISDVTIIYNGRQKINRLCAGKYRSWFF